MSRRVDDEDIFRRAMASLGVQPLAGRRKRGGRPAGKTDTGDEVRPGGPETAEPDEEDALFVANMKDLGRPPDKDGKEAPRKRLGTLRLKASESRDARPEATLDLHGSTTEEALAALARFLAASRKDRLRTVRVVTGKGLRSRDRVPVLKGAVERWLRTDGTKWVEAFSEAPRAMGGRGAYILYLRRR